MEVTVGGVHAVFPMDHATRVGEARRHAAELAELAGCDEVQAGRVALLVTELGNNLLRHAQGGRLLLARCEQRREVQVLAVDEGPGIADLGRCLGDGYSTGGTPGTGLGAIRRLADDFDIHSAVGEGTIVVARVRAAPAPAAARGAFRFSGIAIAAPGEQVCGDGWAVCVHDSVATLVVADGLGHGPDAAAASGAAVQAFVADGLAAPRSLLESIHAELRSTRGAAVSVYRAESGTATIRSAAAGNVMGRLLTGVTDRSLLGQHGTAGVQIRTPQEVSVPWPEHALLVVHSDGIETRWPSALLAPVLGRDPALAAALLMRDHCRGRDDATVVVLGRQE